MPPPPGTDASQAEERRISLRGTDLPLGSVLTQIARSAQLALIIDKDVKTELVIPSPNLENLSVTSALSVVLTPFGYSFAIDPERGHLRIFQNETRTFKVALPVIVQTWQTSISNETSSMASGTGGGAPGAATPAAGGSGGGLGARVALETKSDSKGVWDEVDKSLAGMVGTNGTYSVNRVAGFVTVRAPPSMMVAVASYFDALHEEMDRTVVVETKVLQVDFRDSTAAGVDWAVVGQRLANGRLIIDGLVTTSGLTPASGLVGHFSGSWGEAFIRALEEQGDLRLVAQPTLVLGNNLPAVIEVSSVQSYVSSSTSTVVQGGTVQSAVNTSSISDGLIISILPRLLGNGDVSLALGTVLQDVLEIRRQDTGGGNFIELPRASRRAYNGVVRTKVGESVVIGGLISDREEIKKSGVPFLSKIPIIGFLFGTNQNIKVRSELVVTITTHAIGAAGSAQPAGTIEQGK